MSINKIIVKTSLMAVLRSLVLKTRRGGLRPPRTNVRLNSKKRTERTAAGAAFALNRLQTARPGSAAVCRVPLPVVVLCVLAGAFFIVVFLCTGSGCASL